MQLLHHRQRLTRRVRDHVGVGKSVLLKVSVEYLDLQLERRSVRCGPEQRFLLADTSLSQSGVSDAREMKPAEHVPELVLIPEPLIPIGVKEEVIGFRPRPPRLLEVMIEIRVDADEGGGHTGANGLQLGVREWARWVRQH